MYRWELDGSAQPTFEALSPAVRAILASFMDAVVIVDRSSISVIPASPLTQPSYCARYISASIMKDSSRSWSTLRMTSCSSSGSSGSANEHRLGK